MNWPYCTRLFIVLVTLFVAFFDIIVVTFIGSDATISHQLMLWSYKYPVIPLFAGGLLAHFFWTGKAISSRLVSLSLASAVLLITGIAGYVFPLNLNPVWLCCAGFLLGRFFVPQTKKKERGLC